MKTSGTRIEDSLIGDDDEFLRSKTHPMKIINSNKDKPSLVIMKNDSQN